jgi:hypothetical protein
MIAERLGGKGAKAPAASPPKSVVNGGNGKKTGPKGQAKGAKS